MTPAVDRKYINKILQLTAADLLLLVVVNEMLQYTKLASMRITAVSAVYTFITSRRCAFTLRVYR